MSFRVVRQSKFRHIFGKEAKSDQGYDGIRIGTTSFDNPCCDVNGKFISVIVQAQGGGAFIVIPLNQTGRIDLNHPRICGHKMAVVDIKFCPYNDNWIASAGEDCQVMLWEIPDGGLKEDLREPLLALEGHQRRVQLIEWHPTAENILLSASQDMKIFIWDLNNGQRLLEVELPVQEINSVAWNPIGSHFICTTAGSDKKIRYINARTGKVESIGDCQPNRPKAVFINSAGAKDQVFCAGKKGPVRSWFAKDAADLGSKGKSDELDQQSSTLFPHFDPDTRVLSLWGKGNSNVSFFEIDEDGTPFHLNDYKGTEQKGICFMPKTSLNVNKCEVFRLYKLASRPDCQVVSIIVPRKSTLYQEDIYPDTTDPAPVLSAAEWVGGKDGVPKKISMKQFYKNEDGGSSGGAVSSGGGLNASKGGGLSASKGGGLKKTSTASSVSVSASGGNADARIKELEAIIVEKDKIIQMKEEQLKKVRETYEQLKKSFGA